MGENTKIEWCDHSFNPWVGCAKISPACAHCYAESWAKRAGTPELWNGERRRTSKTNWKQPLKWNREAAAAGVRARVFCASLADVFDNLVPTDWRRDLFRLIEQTPHLDWLLLTKRIGNVEKLMPEGWCEQYRNVWLGATIANREEMLRDARKLKAEPAAVRFWSVEPMLGDLGEIPPELMPHWVICGGESGHGARPMHPAWARSLRDQCAAAGVSFLFKQWGEWAPLDDLPDLSGKRLDVQVNGYTAVRAGKHLAGRRLDGLEHNGFPA